MVPELGLGLGQGGRLALLSAWHLILIRFMNMAVRIETYTWGSIGTL